MANTTLGAVTLHDGANAVITENDSRKESVLSIMPLYLSDSDETDVFDFGGVTKTINLTGVYMAANVAALKTWVDSLQTYLNGHQDTDAGYPKTLTDDLRGTIKVKILDFNTTWSEASPTKVGWTLKLVESSENA